MLVILPDLHMHSDLEMDCASTVFGFMSKSFLWSTWLFFCCSRENSKRPTLLELVHQVGSWVSCLSHARDVAEYYQQASVLAPKPQGCLCSSCRYIFWLILFMPSFFLFIIFSLLNSSHTSKFQNSMALLGQIYEYHWTAIAQTAK